MARKLFIQEATYLNGLSIEVVFNDGARRIVNFEPFLTAHPHPQYNKYRSPHLFSNFKIEHGNIVWGANWDLVFPVEQLYKGILKG